MKKQKRLIIVALSVILICACVFISMRFLANWTWGEIVNAPKQADPLDSPPIGGGSITRLTPIRF